MAVPTRDPFAPPDDGQTPLELAAAPARPRATAAEPLPLPQPRARVVYPKPPGGASNLLLWTFAAVGFVALAAGGVWLWRRQAAGAEQARAPAPPPKPVVWQTLPRGEGVLVTIDVAPRSARLLLDGEPLPSNPVLLPRGSVHHLAALADGFEPANESLTADGARTVRVRLKRAR